MNPTPQFSNTSTRFHDGRAPQRHIPFFTHLTQDGDCTIHILLPIDDALPSQPNKKFKSLSSDDDIQQETHVPTIKFATALLKSSSPVLGHMLDGKFADGTEQHIRLPAPSYNALYLTLWWMLTDTLPFPVVKDEYTMVCQCIQIMFLYTSTISIYTGFTCNHAYRPVFANA